MSPLPRFAAAAVAAAFLVGSGSFAAAQDLKPVRLVKPQMDSGRQLMHVLKDRKSSRSFSERKLPIRVLSNLLWAAQGINRAASGKRTAPSARNWQEIDIYVSTTQGLYLYDPKGHILQPVLARDLRSLTGTQDFVDDAPVNLIYVADTRRMDASASDLRDLYLGVAVGTIIQNVYLYSASEGLATVARGSVDRPTLAAAMGLSPEQKILMAQTVGYPAR